MKKITALLLAAALCLGALAGCSQPASQGSTAPSSEPTQGADSPNTTSWEPWEGGHWDLTSPLLPHR